MLRLGTVPRARSEAFHSGRVGAHEVARDPVLSRWTRAASLGARSEGPANPVGVAGRDLPERRARIEALFAEDEGVLAPLDLGAGRRMMIFADRDGVILYARAQSFDERATRARLVEGATWSERARGTNAIGTALTEKRSVAVIGGAHFERVNQGLFCYATPVLDPFGEVVGAFDVSGDVSDDDPMLATAVLCVGRSLEAALRAQAYAAAVVGGLRVVERMLDRCAMPALLLEAPGAVRKVNEGARSVLGVRGGLAVEDVFGAPWDTIAQAALAGGPAPVFETPRDRFALSLEPILGSQGRVLSILAYFDPIRAPRAARASVAPAPVESQAFARIFGADPGVMQAKAHAERLAPTPLPVVLLAETGTGKELMARAIHDASARAHGPFVAVNCGALGDSLLPSELFGVAPGAFTGAAAGGTHGKIAAARGGTLFLDEIAEMSPALQAMLLRVLEDGTFSRVGDTRVERGDFRLVCATCRDLPAMVEEGTFRSDLFYRIHGGAITLPPVRSRHDRRALAHALMAELARDAGMEPPVLSRDALEHIDAHAWPGNVRELKNALQHALFVARDAPCVRRDHFPTVLLDAPVARIESRRSLRDIEASALEGAMRRAHGNVSQAARALGVSRTTLYRMLDRRRA